MPLSRIATMTARLDPNAAARADSGLFGLDGDPRGARVHVIGVPFDATASYRKGAWRGPAAVLRASRQVDLFDVATGRPYQAGIALLPPDPRLAAFNERASPLADRVIELGGDVGRDASARIALEEVNAIGTHLNGVVREAVERALDDERLPAILGGDHSVPFGAIETAAARHPGLGVLHFDAHADLRHAYEGFTWSHASIMDNVARRIEGVSRLVQVGLRDLCEEESERIEASGGRIRALFDRDWQNARLEGADLRALAREWLADLPKDVWVSFDVDGLDPSLCPNTGTPVPGGLDWASACLWLDELARSGRRVVGFDLCEVNPGSAPEHADSWDAIVGARLLYRLIGTALLTR
jgi:agmatinase